MRRIETQPRFLVSRPGFLSSPAFDGQLPSLVRGGSGCATTTFTSNLHIQGRNPSALICARAATCSPGTTTGAGSFRGQRPAHLPACSLPKRHMHEGQQGPLDTRLVGWSVESKGDSRLQGKGGWAQTGETDGACRISRTRIGKGQPSRSRVSGGRCGLRVLPGF